MTHIAAIGAGRLKVELELPMTELSITYFAELLTLAQDPGIEFRYVRLGDWLDEGIARGAITQFPGKMFLYHYNGNLRASESETQALIATLQTWQRWTGCPWLSAHLDYHTNEEIHGLIREGRRPPRYDAEEAFALICRAAQTVQAHLSVPLLLENVPHWPLPEGDVAVMPDFIGRVLEETQCGLLLDIPHARIAVAALGCDVRSYLEEFPLDRVVEVHVSGMRHKNGRWTGSHEPLQHEDYALLEWLLRRTAPRAVTLEYWKDPAQARDQILRLNKLIAQVNGEKSGNGS